VGNLAKFVIQVYRAHLQAILAVFSFRLRIHRFITIHHLIVKLNEELLHLACRFHADVQRNRDERRVQQKYGEESLDEFCGIMGN
jgi:hypothetical protein